MRQNNSPQMRENSMALDVWMDGWVDGWVGEWRKKPGKGLLTAIKNASVDAA